MASRQAARAAVVFLLAMSIATPHALGGSATDPHIEDGCESDSTQNALPEPLDIDKAWVGPFLDKEVVIQLCGDIARGETPIFGGHDEAAIARYGWQFRFNDTFGSQWNVKMWSQLGNVLQCVTKDGTKVGQTERQGLATPYPVINEEKNRLIMHFPPRGLIIDMLIRRDLHAVSVVHNDTTPFDTQCGNFYTVQDRAPDEGFGRDVNLTPPPGQPDSIPVAVDLSTRRDDIRVRPGTTAEIPFTAEKDDPVHRQMKLRVDAPKEWSPNLDVSWIDPDDGTLKTVDFGTQAPLVLRPLTSRNRTILSLDVPKSTPPGTYPIEMEGTVRNETRFFAGRVSARTNVTVPPFGVSIDGHETRFLVKPNGSIVNELTITNEGEATDSYDLSLSGEPLEWATLERDGVALDPGESATVELAVDVPANATDAVHSHTVEVVSRTLPRIDDRITTTTQVLDAVLADPLGAVQAGEPTPTVVGLYALAIGGLAIIGAAAGKP